MMRRHLQLCNQTYTTTEGKQQACQTGTPAPAAYRVKGGALVREWCLPYVEEALLRPYGGKNQRFARIGLKRLIKKI